MKKMTFLKTDFDYIKKIVDLINQNIKDKPIVLDEIGSVSDSWEIKRPSGAYEIDDIYNYIQQILLLYHTLPGTISE